MLLIFGTTPIENSQTFFLLLCVVNENENLDSVREKHLHFDTCE
jgi:hypothetical protein